MSTTNKRHNPSEICAPTQNLYSHGVEAPAGSRILHVAGEIGVRPDGTLPTTLEGQVEQLMQNFKAILASAGMGFDDIVKVQAYCLSREDIFTYAHARNKYFSGNPPATTAIVVAGLASPDWLIEVDMVAARAD